MVNVHLSQEDKDGIKASSLRLMLSRLFSITEIKEITINKKNIDHYQRIQKVNVGDTISAMITRLYKENEGFDTLYSNRLYQGLKIPEAKEKDFIIDEIYYLQDLIELIQKYDANNFYKGIARSYVEYLQQKKKIFYPIPDIRTEPDISKPVPKENKLESYFKSSTKAKLMTVIKDQFSGAKPQRIAYLLHALEKLKIINFYYIKSVAFTHKLLTQYLGYIGTREALTIQLSNINHNADDHAKEIEIIFDDLVAQGITN